MADVKPPKADTAEGAEEQDQSITSWLMSELFGSPVNIVLLLAICFIVYKILKPDSSSGSTEPSEPPIPPMKKQDLTLQQLKEYDGVSREDGRVCVAVNNKIFDVTKGKRFYGPGGPYSSFAGRDASRGLATFSVDCIKDDYDDLSDLKPSEMDQVKEWELQFSEKYDLVGKLLKPGEEATHYSDEEESEDEEGDKKTN